MCFQTDSPKTWTVADPPVITGENLAKLMEER
jgi:hypothetical protein